MKLRQTKLNVNVTVTGMYIFLIITTYAENEIGKNY